MTRGATTGRGPRVRAWGRRTALVALVGLAAACTGSGSDIGPDIPYLSTPTYVVAVRDAADRPVCNALVAVAGPVAGSIAGAASTGRNGRADVPAAVGPAVTIEIDASTATATAGDRFGSIRFSAPGAPIEELPFVAFLPDLAGSSERVLEVGTVTSTITLDDSGWSGAVLTIGAGTRVARAGAGDAALAVRTGALPADRAPPQWLDGSSGPVLCGRAVAIEPLALRLEPAAALSMPNELGLSAGATCELRATDPVTGDWRRVADGVVSSDGQRIDVAAGAVAHGGLYTFAIAAAATTTVAGRIVSPGATEALSDVLVRAGDRFARVGPGGRFELREVAAADAAGVPRELDLLVQGSRYREARSTTRRITALPGGTVAVGDVELDAVLVTPTRLLSVSRGAGDPWTTIAISSTEQLWSELAISDGVARADLVDVPAGFVSFVRARPDPQRQYDVRMAEGFAWVPARERVVDYRLFTRQEPWAPGGRVTRVWVADAIGGGLIDGAIAYRRYGEGDHERLYEASRTFVPRMQLGPDSDATVAVETSAGGRTLLSAFTARGVTTGRLEAPLLRAVREPLGSFAPHALLAGTAPAGGSDVVVSTQPVGVAEDWLDRALRDEPLRVDVPRPLEPTAGAREFVIGVPAPHGGLVALTGDRDAADRLMAAQLALVPDPPLDRTRVQTIELAQLASFDQRIVLPDLFLGRDAAVPLDAFALDLAAELADRRLFEIGRRLAQVGAVGNDAELALPPFAGRLRGARFLAVVVARVADATLVREQRGVFRLQADQPAPRAPLLPLPRVVAPLPGASVPVAGFAIDLEPPPGALYQVLTLSRTSDDTLRTWTVVLPGDATHFTFAPLPDGPELLSAGSYRLRVEATRVRGETLNRQALGPYQAAVARWISIGADEKVVGAVSAVELGLELVP
ncbi:MAG: hypothetical protein IPM29_29495 [Planctomycetes bacterium]|nr:hypothetical protein [Planctomycetota bacterium]